MWPTAAVVAVVAALLTAGVILTEHRPAPPARSSAMPPPPAGSGHAEEPSGLAAVPVTAPNSVPHVTAADLARLPEATTDTTIPGTPVDTDRAAGTDGAVVHNRTPVAVFDTPGGTPFARLPTTQAGSTTWLPVTDRQPGWVRVLLPNRPNGAAGWLDATAVDVARTPYEIRASVHTRSVTLIRDGVPVGRWTIAVGAARTPTPTGRTFLLAQIHDPAQTFSPVILALGTHSAVLASYHGGPATTALHTWPDHTVFGHAVSNGCLRIPSPALAALTSVPLGTLVRIDP
ncbi:L,D-transpeptidase [Dactylosporangium darangshiense]|uniref:L,D-transpeptidase n=1 Tax=Dactylosporangium darangshiense TaxID=579108 RepID=UPI00363BBE33